jgi:DNA polymerase
MSPNPQDNPVVLAALALEYLSYMEELGYYDLAPKLPPKAPTPQVKQQRLGTGGVRPNTPAARTSQGQSRAVPVGQTRGQYGPEKGANEQNVYTPKPKARRLITNFDATKITLSATDDDIQEQRTSSPSPAFPIKPQASLKSLSPSSLKTTGVRPSDTVSQINATDTFKKPITPPPSRKANNPIDDEILDDLEVLNAMETFKTLQSLKGKTTNSPQKTIPEQKTNLNKQNEPEGKSSLNGNVPPQNPKTTSFATAKEKIIFSHIDDELDPSDESYYELPDSLPGSINYPIPPKMPPHQIDLSLDAPGFEEDEDVLKFFDEEYQERQRELLNSSFIKNSKTLPSLIEGIKTCNLCPFGHNKKGKVTGQGKIGAKIMFVSGPPSLKSLNEKKYPENTEANVLNELLKDLFKLKVQDVFITPIIKCVPLFENFVPQTKKFCRAITLKEIEIVNPSLVIALGPDASQILFDSSDVMFHLRKKTQETLEIKGKFIPFAMVYSLSSMAENEEIKNVAYDDLMRITTKYNIK